MAFRRGCQRKRDNNNRGAGTEGNVSRDSSVWIYQRDEYLATLFQSTHADPDAHQCCYSFVLDDAGVLQKRGTVNKITIAILFFSPLLASAAGDPNPAEYTVKVHVSSSSMDHGTQLLDVVIDGKKYELKSELPVGRLLALGDFKAKLVMNRKTAYESFQVYEFLFPDKTRQYEVVGQTE